MGLTDEELRAQMMAEAEAAIERVLREKRGSDEITLSEIEELAVAAREAVGEGIAAALVEASMGEAEEPPACPECGVTMRYKGQKDKWVISEAGEVKVSRTYYHCRECERGLFPLDERWRLNASSYSDRLSQQMVWLSGVVPSFEQAEAVFARIGHRQIPRMSIWRQTQRHGQRLQDHLLQQQETVRPERVVLPPPGATTTSAKGSVWMAGWFIFGMRAGRNSRSVRFTM